MFYFGSQRIIDKNRVTAAKEAKQKSGFLHLVAVTLAALHLAKFVSAPL